MRMRTVLFLSVILTLPVTAQVLDRIVAVVDNDFILESELNAQIQFFVFNNRVDPSTPGLKEQVLQSMINDKLIIAQAIEDSIVVSDDEVQQQLDAAIQQRVQALGSEARVEELYGMPINRIKREFREEMRNQLIAQRLQQQRFGGMHVSRREVEEFLAEYRDSLGTVPEEVEMAHIYMEPTFSPERKAAAQAELTAILDSIRAGADFAEMATRHSEDPGSAPRGGDLGFVRRGLFVREFESTVFGLTPGEVSGVVETELGLHIIQLIEKRGNTVHARHILKRIERTQADEDTVVAFLRELRRRALAGENFAELAKQYSHDKETAVIGGSLGVAELGKLERDFHAAVSSLQPGEISEPLKLRVGATSGYHIVLMKKRVPEHAPTLEADYPRLEAIALNLKRQKEYTRWLDQLKKNIYWESRL